MIVANSPLQWSSWTWCRKWWNHSWHSSRVTLNQRCFAFIRPRSPLVYRYHVISRTQSHGAVLVAPHRTGVAPRAPRVVTLLTVEQLLYWSDWICTGRAAQIEANTKFRFWNIVPKQWTLSGFVQHTSANSMYKDDYKISRQQKVLHMNEMLERVPHFQTSFSVGIQPLSSRRNHHGSTLCTPLSIDQLFIFGIFEHKWGTRKHIDDLKKYSWCIPVQRKIKHIIWGPQ